jgi:uncharacterized FlaG/YvyC family protein
MDISGVNRNGPVAPVTVATISTESNSQNRELIQAIKAVNGAEMFGERNELQFQKDPQTQRMVIRMVDRHTKEVMSQIPAKYVLELAAQVKEQK